MTTELRRLLHAYTSRRSPWGPPWWIYGVTFGAANVARQAFILTTDVKIPQSIRVASWALTALLVIAIINAACIALGRGQRAGPGSPSTLRPTWPFHWESERHAPERGLTTHRVTTDQPIEGPPSNRWAPWWLYLVVIIGANYLRRGVLPEPDAPGLRVLVALGVSAVLFALITALHRAQARRGTPARR